MRVVCGLGDVGAVVLRDRKHLAEDGMVVVVLPISAQNGDLLAEQAVEYRRLADIRAADYYDESGSCLSHNFSSYR